MRFTFDFSKMSFLSFLGILGFPFLVFSWDFLGIPKKMVFWGGFLGIFFGIPENLGFLGFFWDFARLLEYSDVF